VKTWRKVLGFVLLSSTGSQADQVIYVDDFVLISRTNVGPATNVGWTIRVEPGSDRHSIDPRIYGVAYADSNDLQQLNATLNRQGGNNTSRYNWLANADNRANDYFFLSIPYDSPTPGEHVDQFVVDTRNGGAEPSLTIPMLDWVARVGPSREWLWSYSVAKYGTQKASEPFRPDCGNGVRPDGSWILNNNPADANIAAGPEFQQGWLNHLVQRWGTSANGGVRYYHLDNEPGIWHASHRDVHPAGATMKEMRGKLVAYATRIKATDPGALVLGPEEWHFFGSVFSGADSQYDATNGFRGVFPDRSAHGNSDVYPYLLRELSTASASAGRRLLDVCSIHYYPQGGEFSDDVTPAIQQLRNRSTRSLWDPTYVEENWLADNPLTKNVRLIPRMKAWVKSYFPGTQIGLTEYNWGAEQHINGATAQADILGILGREGLDLAERWTTPSSGSPAFKAFQMYRNYDGAHSGFGEISVKVSNPASPDLLAVFAAQRSLDSALTLMLVHKALSTSTSVTLALTNFAASDAQVWRLTSANNIDRLADKRVTDGTVQVDLPSQSITLLILADRAPRLEIRRMTGLSLMGSAGQRYRIDSSMTLATWSPWSTQTLASASVALPFPVPLEPHRFFRATWLP
jgi:Glycoside hydrolase family 44